MLKAGLEEGRLVTLDVDDGDDSDLLTPPSFSMLPDLTALNCPCCPTDYRIDLICAWLPFCLLHFQLMGGSHLPLLFLLTVHHAKVLSATVSLMNLAQLVCLQSIYWFDHIRACV